MSNELAGRIDYSRRVGELHALLERQVRLYTMGDSSSLPVETARELTRSIEFTIALRLSRGGAADDPLETLFTEGGKDIWRLVEEAKRLYAAAQQTDPGYGSVSLRDTLDAVGGFFRAYDLRFFAHGIPCMIDYPLCLPVPEPQEGVLFIGEYLRRLLVEHRFCRCFGRTEAVGVLTRLDPEYRELVLNLFEPLLTCALGLVLLDRDPGPLRLTGGDADRLRGLLHPLEDGPRRTLTGKAAALLCNGLGLRDTATRAYVAEASLRLLPLLKAGSPEGYRNLFCAR